MTKDKIIKSLAIQIGVFFTSVPLYIFWIVIANKYPTYKWEIIVGFVYYVILCSIEQAKDEKN